MTNRKCHVKRIYSEDESSYIDVLRLDEIEVNGSVIDGVRGQKITIQIDWDDEVNEAQEPGRTYSQIVIPNPPAGEGPAPGQPITLNVIQSIKFVVNGQLIEWFFDNSVSASRQYTPIQVVSNVPDPPKDFTGTKPWDAYQTFVSGGVELPSFYINTAVPEVITQFNSKGQLSFTTLNNTDVKKFIGNRPVDGDPVILDPFQYIVNVFWGVPEVVYVNFAASWWGLTPDLIECSGDETFSYIVPIVNTSPYEPFVGYYGPGFFSTQGELRPSVYRGAGPDGVIDIAGYAPGDKYEVSGIPPISGTISTSPLRVLFMNQDDWYDNPDIVGEDNRMSRVIVHGFSVDFILRTPNLLFRRFCQQAGAPPGYKWQIMDQRAMGYIQDFPFTDPDIAYRDAYSFEAGRQTLNFAGVRVRRISDGKVYVPESISGSLSPNSFDQVGISINMTPSKKSGG